MSRIGKKPVLIPEEISVELKDNTVYVKGKNAELSLEVLPGIEIELENNRILLYPKRENKQTVSNWGTMRALLQNAITGASENFVKQLIIDGVGYRASIEGKELVLSLGYSHPIRFRIPDGVSVIVEKENVTVTGPDKELVGNVAAKIRSFRKPEPYKGKGIRYKNEVVRRKPGKKAVGVTGM